MANTKSAEKAARQALKRRDNNVAARSKFRTVIRDVTQAIGSGTKNEALEQYNAAVPVIDSMVNKSQIHRNKAARATGSQLAMCTHLHHRHRRLSLCFIEPDRGIDTW